MTTSHERVELLIDIFDQREQRAEVLPTLTPIGLIEAILQEFQELNYLGDRADAYQIFQGADDAPLDANRPLHEQINGDSRLRLVELEKPLPPNTARPTENIYLREQSGGRVYKLHWLPAIIGRWDANQDDNERLAVDLDAFETGLRVSRRHAQITQDADGYWIESLASNPTSITNAAGETISVMAGKQPLHPGDVVYLERSGIGLRFLKR